MRAKTPPHPLASRAGFASGPGGLLTVAFLAVMFVAALVFALDGRPGDLAAFAEATAEHRVLPSCPSVIPLPSEAVREGGMGYFFARHVERADDGSLVLTRTLDGGRLNLWWGAVGAAALLWVIAFVLFNAVDSHRLDEFLNRRPKLKIALLVGGAFPGAVIGLVLVAGIFFLLPTLPHTLVSRKHVMRIGPERVTVEARVLPGRIRETVVPVDRIVGVDAWLGVRIVYREADGVLRGVRVPIAADDLAMNVACAAAQLLVVPRGG